MVKAVALGLPPNTANRVLRPQLDEVATTGFSQALRVVMEAGLAAADPYPGRRWNPWEFATIWAVDTVGIGLLRVRYGDAADPRFPAPRAVRRARPGAGSRP